MATSRVTDYDHLPAALRARIDPDFSPLAPDCDEDDDLVSVPIYPHFTGPAVEFSIRRPASLCTA